MVLLASAFLIGWLGDAYAYCLIHAQADPDFLNAIERLLVSSYNQWPLNWLIGGAVVISGLLLKVAAYRWRLNGALKGA